VAGPTPATGAFAAAAHLAQQLLHFCQVCVAILATVSLAREMLHKYPPHQAFRPKLERMEDGPAQT
jgi:hypothetical protein